MNQTKFSSSGKTTVPAQIADALKQDIESGLLKANDKLMSINDFSKKYGVARDSVEKAYKKLKAIGYITSISAKGYYVAKDYEKRVKVLLIFNKLSYYKKVIYDAIVQTLGNRAQISLFIHQYNPATLKEIIEQNQGSYNFIVLMPHFFHSSHQDEYLDIIQKIPQQELILLDKQLPQLHRQKGVFQNFKDDIYEALKQAGDLLQKYREMIIIFPEYSHHPTETKDGIKQFCLENNLGFSVSPNLNNFELKPGMVFITLTESDLGQLIKMVRQSPYQLGQDIGSISFNETIFKELLDITVITTDFKKMGQSVADMILNNEDKVVANPFSIILRKSL